MQDMVTADGQVLDRAETLSRRVGGAVMRGAGVQRAFFSSPSLLTALSNCSAKSKQNSFLLKYIASATSPFHHGFSSCRGADIYPTVHL